MNRKSSKRIIVVVGMALCWAQTPRSPAQEATPDPAAELSSSIAAMIERSAHIRRNARPSYESEALAKLGKNPRNGPYFRFDDLLATAQIRESAALAERPSPSSLLISYEFDDPTDPGLVLERKSSFLKDGLLVFPWIQDRIDLQSSAPLSIPRDEVGEIAIRARATEGTRMRLKWVKEGGDHWRSKLDIDLILDGEFHTYVINATNALKRGLAANEKLGKIRLVVQSTGPEASASVDYIRFVGKLGKYQQHRRGTAYETIDKEMRRVLYMSPTQTIEYSVDVPEKTPTLDFGTAVLLDNEPVHFEVSLSDQGRTTTLYSGRQETPDAWTDIRLSLSRWAGKPVTIAFRVSGSVRNIAFWSNPLLFSEPEEKFKIVVILEDTERADHLSVYGYPRPTTPTRKKLLARSGIVFLNAFAQSTKTRPSVPSIMTSLQPTATGVIGWSNMLDDSYLTLAEILRSQGFVTASFLQNGNAGPWAGLHQGFSTLLDEETLAEETVKLYGDEVGAWLERHRDQNTFLYLHTTDPHGEYDPPKPFDAWYHEKRAPGTPVRAQGDLDPDWVTQPTAEGRRLLYDGEIRHNDALLAKFLTTLGKNDGLRDTLLVFISDHGEHLGERGVWEHQPPGYIQAIGVPFMMVYPKRFSRPQRIPQTVQLMDLMPTILELAGIDSSGLLIQGDSLIDLIEGRRPSYWNNRLSVSEEPMTMLEHKPCGCGSIFFRNLHGLRSRDIPPVGKYRPYVFDFWKDPQEAKALAGSFLAERIEPALREMQKNNIAAWRRWTGGEVETYKMDPDVLEHLRGLGYVHD